MTAPRIVLLDHAPFSLGAMHAPLTDEGYRVFRCRPRDLADAHVMVKRATVDLVILDRWLGKRADSWALLGRLSADRETAHIAAIMAIGKSETPPDPPDLSRVMRCRVIAKPFDADELLAAIATMLLPSPMQRGRVPSIPTNPLADPSMPDLYGSRYVAVEEAL